VQLLHLFVELHDVLGAEDIELTG
jgi:hypothetical protein